jgi:hypothetical protein
MGMARMMQEAWNRRRVALFHLVLEKACSVPSGRQLTSVEDAFRSMTKYRVSQPVGTPWDLSILRRDITSELRDGVKIRSC